MADSAAPRIPGPKGHWLSGNLGAYEANRLEFLTESRRRWGGVVRFSGDTTIVNDPDHARLILDSSAEFGVTENFLQEPIGLDQQHWVAELRQLLNPPLRLRQVESVATAAAQSAAQRLLSASPGTWIDPVEALDGVVVNALAFHYFGTDNDWSADTGALLDALARVIGNPFAFPASWGTPARRAIRTTHTAVQARVLKELCRADGGAVAELVERGVSFGWSHERIAGAIVGSLLAAHRVPVASLSWMLLCVAERPRLQEQLRHVCAADPATDGLARGVDLADAVVLESLRLYPATWLITRRSSTAFSLGPYRFAAGHNFMISPYVLHRDERLFDNPEAFRPERWLTRTAIPGAFLPFGRGLHRCPGRDFATALMRAVLVELASSTRLTKSPEHVDADATTTLTPRGLRVRAVELEARSSMLLEASVGV
jgi:cytochrome P450